MRQKVWDRWKICRKEREKVDRWNKVRDRRRIFNIGGGRDGRYADNPERERRWTDGRKLGTDEGYSKTY